MKPKSGAWDHFTFDGVKKKYTCNYCKNQFRQHATAWEDHLSTKCSGLTAGQRSNFIKKFNKGKLERRVKKAQDLLQQQQQHKDAECSSSTSDEDLEVIDTSNTFVASSAPTSSKQSNKKGQIVEMFEQIKDEKVVMDDMLCEMLCVLGLPFHVVDHPLFAAFLKKLKPSYILPSRYELSNRLLERVYKEIKEKMDDRVGAAKVLCLMFDGWSNIKNDSILNFMLGTPLPIFYSSLWTGVKPHTGNNMFLWASQVMELVGPRKFLGVCTDSASAMVLAKTLLQEKYPWLVVYACMDHILNNLMKDIFKYVEFQTFIENCSQIAARIKKSQILLAKFNEIQERVYGSVRRLRNPGQTRFGSYRILLKSLHDTKQALRELALDTSIHALPQELSELLLLNNFWSNVERSRELLDPLCDWIIKLQGDEPLIADVVEAFHEINTKMEEMLSLALFPNHEKERIRSCVKRRREFAITDLHLAANLLHPGYKGRYLSNTEFKAAEKYIDTLTQYQDFSLEEKKSALSDLSDFLSDSDLFSDRHIYEASQVSALSWWKRLASRSKLAIVAEKILQMHSTASSCERSFSTFSNIHTRKRNRLTVDRATKITYIQHNWNLINRKKIKKLKHKIGGEPDSDSDDEDSDEADSDHELQDSDDEFEPSDQVEPPSLDVVQQLDRPEDPMVIDADLQQALQEVMYEVS